MLLKIVQVGEPVLRKRARALTKKEIKSPEVQQLIALMRETMRDAPGVGLAAPQVGVALQLAVIEDRMEDEERDRKTVPFQVIINPQLEIIGDETIDFFEGCLSVEGFTGIVRRAKHVLVTALDEHGEPITIEAEGWYARILQHEIDHLNGTVYIDRMDTRSFSTNSNFSRHFGRVQVAELKAFLAEVE